MDASSIDRQLAEYGVDVTVLEEYDYDIVRTRIVRDTLKLVTTAGPRALKKKYMNVERLSYIFQAIEFLFSNGYSHVPRFIRTRYDDPFVVHEDEVFYMTKWLSGRSVDCRKEEEFLMASRELARWHNAAAGFVPKDVSHPKILGTIARLEQGHRRIREFCERVRVMDHHSPFLRLLLVSESELSERVLYALENLATVQMDKIDQTAVEHNLLCHGGFTGQNIIFDGQQLTAWDYDRIHQGATLVELASLLHRYMGDYDWNEEILTRIIQAYAEQRTMAEEEREQLAALLSIPMRSTQVVFWYETQAKDWDEEDYVDYFEETLLQDERREAARQVVSRHNNSIFLAHMPGFQMPAKDVGLAAEQSTYMRSYGQASLTEDINQMDETPDDGAMTETKPKTRRRRRKRVRHPRIWGDVSGRHDDG